MQQQNVHCNNSLFPGVRHSKMLIIFFSFPIDQFYHIKSNKVPLDQFFHT